MRNVNQAILGLPHLAKRAIVIVADGVLCCVSVFLAYFLRLDAWPEVTTPLIVVLALATVSALVVFAALGLYRAMFRHSGWQAMRTVMIAIIVAALPMVAVVTMMGLPGVPRSIGILQPIVLLLLVVTSRAIASALLGDRRFRPSGRPSTRVVVYGAGSAGRQLVSALQAGSEMQVVAYLDDDPKVQNRTLNGVPVIAPSGLERLIDRRGVSHVLLALPSISRKRRSAIIAQLRSLPVHVQTLPGLADLAQGRVQLGDLRELEIEDLLGRDPVRPNAILLGRNIVGKTVLVTGAGGSIGSELCRQIARIGPTKLLLLDASEFALYSIHHELARVEREADCPALPVIPLLGSVTDKRRLAEIFSIWRPDTVYHAAAYKHVPLVEHNVAAGIVNNVGGTLAAAEAALAYGVDDFVLISTDKAVRPTNVMGASKRLSELVLQALAASQPRTRFSIVRFGNVLGSSGSVVPLFRRQIREGGPVTVTHPDITRYFMTIPEAAQLVIQAGAMAAGGEVFVLDMGEPVRIIDLAHNMIELSGLSVRSEDNPDGDIAIETIGLRPGEKMFEELLIGNNPQPTRHQRIWKAEESFLPWGELEGHLAALMEALDQGDLPRARALLKLQVPEYCPDQELKDWTLLQREAG